MQYNDEHEQEEHLHYPIAGCLGKGGSLGRFKALAIVIERVLRNYFREKARDLELINAAADRLNSEVADVVEYQVFEE